MTADENGKINPMATDLVVVKVFRAELPVGC